MGMRLLHECSIGDKHSANVSAIGCVGDNALSGSDDGHLKLWTPDLRLIKDVDTAKGGILSLAVAPEAIYTCGSDQTIQAWDRNTLENIGQIQTTLYVPLKVFLEQQSNTVWAGDSQGNVAKFCNMTESGKYELVEEVWDLYVTTDPDIIYTARDRDVAIFQIVPGATKTSAVLKATLPGRSPLIVVSNNVCCLDRNGTKIQVHENRIESKFKLLREIQASQSILNAFCVSGESGIYTGGYDSKVSLWDLNSATCQGSVDVSACVNALQTSATGTYVATADGKVLLVGP